MVLKGIGGGFFLAGYLLIAPETQALGMLYGAARSRSVQYPREKQKRDIQCIAAPVGDRAERSVLNSNSVTERCKFTVQRWRYH